MVVWPRSRDVVEADGTVLRKTNKPTGSQEQWLRSEVVDGGIGSTHMPPLINHWVAVVLDSSIMPVVLHKHDRPSTRFSPLV